MDGWMDSCSPLNNKGRRQQPVRGRMAECNVYMWGQISHHIFLFTHPGGLCSDKKQQEHLYLRGAPRGDARKRETGVESRNVLITRQVCVSNVKESNSMSSITYHSVQRKETFTSLFLPDRQDPYARVRLGCLDPFLTYFIGVFRVIWVASIVPCQSIN